MGLDNPIHIVFIVVILLLLFGAKRLPEIGRSLGSGMREFKDGISGHGTDGQSTAVQPAQPALTQSAQAPPPAAVQPAAQAFGTPAPVAAPEQPAAEPAPEPQTTPQG